MVQVLVLDNDEPTRSVIRMALELEGYAVEENTTSEQALAVLTSAPSPLVVLMDLHLVRRQPNVILEALTSHAHLAAAHAYIFMNAGTQADAKTALSRLANFPVALLVKPFNLDDLVWEVSEAVRRLSQVTDGEAVHEKAADGGSQEKDDLKRELMQQEQVPDESTIRLPFSVLDST